LPLVSAAVAARLIHRCHNPPLLARVGERHLRAKGRVQIAMTDQVATFMRIHVVVPEEDNRSFAWPYGLMPPGQLFALWARRYAAVHGLSDEDLTQALGSIAVTQRRYANNNPAAMMRDRKMDSDDYRNARMISEPLRLFDRWRTASRMSSPSSSSPRDRGSCPAAPGLRSG
jgi:hypothetical protein